jgi:hypothetical protein
MRRASMGLLGVGLLVLALVVFQVNAVRGAASYADPLFQQQWQQGEALTPNFWGPLSTAKDGQQEPYQQAAGGQRLVQYFDKGRMELSNGVVTNGLLASEIVKGQLQVGDAAFLQKDAPAIPIAGDTDNPGPTYKQLGTTAKALLAATAAQPNGTMAATVGGDGTVTPGASELAGSAALTTYDSPTQHNVPGVFDAYRTKAGLATIGYAISEPFGAVVKVAGQQKGVLIQIFERRVLTFTPTNDPAFQVEMGNIGQHYYTWRYSGGTSGSTAPTASAPSASATQTGSSSAVLPSVITSPLPTSAPPPFPTVAHQPVPVPPGVPPLNDPAIFQPPTNLTCATFHSQAAAQAYLRAFPNDPSNLDPGRTGVACPNNPGPFDRVPVART